LIANSQIGEVFQEQQLDSLNIIEPATNDQAKMNDILDGVT